MKWAGVIFDRDGTIFDSFRVILAAFNHAIEPFTSRHPSDAEWFSAFGPAEREVIAKFIPAENKQEAFERFYRYYNDHLDGIRVFPGIEEIFQKLKQSGAKIAMFTGGGKESTQLVLSGKGIAKYFDALITGDRVNQPKPDPEGIILALSTLKVPADQVLVVGDAGADMIAGQKAGAKTALVRWSKPAPPYDLPSRPDYTFNTVLEFKKFLFEEEKR
jgi:HAD superfamily hydrolase (TIGR01509 family)